MSPARSNVYRAIPRHWNEVRHVKQRQSTTLTNTRCLLRRERLPTFPCTNCICTRYKRHLYRVRMPTYQL